MNGALLVTLPSNSTSYFITNLDPQSVYIIEVEGGDYSNNMSTTGPSRTIYVSILGDVNQDCRVDILDIALVAFHFGTRTGDLGYDPITDLNNDGSIDILDIALTAFSFGQAC